MYNNILLLFILISSFILFNGCIEEGGSLQDGKDILLSTYCSESTDNTPVGNLTVVDSFPMTTSKIHGLAFDGSNLWYSDQSENKIYKIDNSGNIIFSFNSPGPSPTGLTFDGTYLWNTNDSNFRIYKLDTTGNVLGSFRSAGSDSTGLTFDGIYLWNAGFFSERGRIHKMNTYGFHICTFYTPDSSPEGLAFDGTYLWNIDVYSNKIYQLNTRGDLVATFNSPGTNHPLGLTYDGTFLWLADQSTIFKISLN
jgi:hypothetical protein